MTALPTAAVTGFGIAVTVGAYTLSLRARKRYPSPLTTPVLFSTVIIIGYLVCRLWAREGCYDVSTRTRYRRSCASAL